MKKKLNLDTSFKNENLVNNILKKIDSINIPFKLNVMEICGGHTHSIQQFGLDKLLEKKINFLSGPGCPVCVTPETYIDKAIELSYDKKNIILTFGDVLRVAGSNESLETARASGADVRVFYSPFEILKIAKKFSDKLIIFLAIGFETTVPITAQLLEFAIQEKIKNIKFFSAHKTIIEPMEFLLENKNNRIDAFICPGHVSTIIGSNAYKIIVDKFQKPCVISGFEPIDILYSIYMIMMQYRNNKIKIENAYSRGVTQNGNLKAKRIIKKYFYKIPSLWRGIGIINNSGLEIKNEYENLKINFDYSHKNIINKKNKNCICGLILQGLKKPNECKLFAKVCCPTTPIGACMVSSEGACAAYYKWMRKI